MKIGGLVAWPFALMVCTYVLYQLMLKLPRPGINILAFQTLAYAVALVAVDPVVAQSRRRQQSVRVA